MTVFSWGAETWLSLFEAITIFAGVISAGAGVLAVAALIGTSIVSKEVNRKQEVALETEKVKRLELEEFVMPRVLKNRSTAQLTQFRGVEFIINHQGDPESLRLAKQINEVLLSAGWVSRGIRIRSDLPDGVIVTRRGIGDRPEHPEMTAAIRGLLSFLTANDIEARSGLQDDFLVPAAEDTVILVAVGLRPFDLYGPAGSDYKSGKKERHGRALEKAKEK